METRDPLAEALAELAKVNVEVKALAPQALPKVLSASRTIGLITGAAGALDKYGHGWGRIMRSNLNALKRPPAILSAVLFKKHN